MREAYLKAVRYEWMFWDSAYRLRSLAGVREP